MTRQHVVTFNEKLAADSSGATCASDDEQPASPGNPALSPGRHLVRLCLERPEMAGPALAAVAEIDDADGLFGELKAEAEALARMQARAVEAENDIADRVLAAVERLLEADRTEDAANALSLAAELGADAGQVGDLTRRLAGDMLRAMRAAVNEGDDRKAHDLASALVRISPRSSEGWLVSGRMLLRFDRPEEACAALERAVEYGGSSQNALLNLSRAEIRCGKEREGMLTLFKLLRISEMQDGRYTPLAMAELDELFGRICQRLGSVERDGDHELLDRLFGTLIEIAGRRTGDLPGYVAQTRRAAGYASVIAKAGLALGRGREALDVCAAVTEVEPEHAVLWSVLGRLRLHYHENAQAEEAFRRSLELSPDQISVLDGLAETLFRQGRSEEALEVADQAVALDADSANARQRRDRIAAHLESVSRAHPGAAEGRRAVAIVGMPDPGHDLLGLWLSQAEGVRFVGESLWVGGRGHAGGWHGVDGGPEAKFAACQLCRGTDCEALDLEFRRELSNDPADWYWKLAEKLDCSVLVSADNSPTLVHDLEPLGRADSLVVFRAPARAWSALKRNYLEANRAVPPLHQFLRNWTRLYLSVLEDAGTDHRQVFLDIDRFYGEPDAVFDALLKSLELDGLALDPSAAETNHVFGVDMRAIVDEGGVARSPLFEREAALQEMDGDAVRLYRDAEDLYHRLSERALSA